MDIPSWMRKTYDDLMQKREALKNRTPVIRTTEENLEAQQNEVMALESIMGNEAFIIYEGSSPLSGKIIIDFAIKDDTTCKVVDCSTLMSFGKAKSEGSSANGTEYEEAVVKHLPPLVLHFTLPDDYPTSAIPIYTLESNYLDRTYTTFLCQMLDLVWETTMEEVLYAWVDFLNSEAIEYLSAVHGDGKIELRLRKKPSVAVHLKEKRDHSRRRFSAISLNAVDSPVVQGSSSKVPVTSACSNGSATSATSKGSATSVIAGSSRTSTPVSAQSQTAENSNGNLKVSESRHNISKNNKVTKHLDPRAVFDPSSAHGIGLIPYLVDYSEKKEITEFNRVSHCCPVCFTEKFGTEFILFKCKHAFCKDCVTECYKTHITEGSVDAVKCLAHNCVEIPSSAQVEATVGQELFNRYDSLLLKKALESMDDLMYCPRDQCGKPVIVDADEKLGCCNFCCYRFCTTCKMVFHGVEPCRFKSDEKEKLVQEYTKATKEEKLALEKTYGKRQIELIIQSSLSEQYIIKESKPCPHCKVPIEKSEGCNKVTCTKCGSYFCWLCSKQLDKSNPYFHFQDPSSPCHNNLFQNDDAESSDDSDNGIDEMDDEDDFEDEVDDDDFFAAMDAALNPRVLNEVDVERYQQREERLQIFNRMIDRARNHQRF